MTLECIPISFPEWLLRGGLLIVGLSVAWSIVGPRAGRALAVVFTALTTLMSLPWAIRLTNFGVWNSMSKPGSIYTSLPMPQSGTTWMGALGMIWMAGATFLFLRRLQAVRQLHQWCRPPKRTRVDGARKRWKQTCQSLPMEARREYRLAVRFIPGLSSPAVWQTRRAWLFLPIQARHWSEATRRRVLLHELGHIHRHDGWLLLLWHGLDLVHWWNPCWWRLKSRWELSLECAADDWVIRWCPGESREYARMLLELASNQNPNSTVPTLGGGRLESRIQRLITTPTHLSRWSPMRSIAGCLFMGFASVWLACHPTGDTQRHQSPVSPDEVARRLAADPFPLGGW